MLLLVAIAALGVVASRSTTAILTRQIDREIGVIANRGGTLLPRLAERTDRPQVPLGYAVMLFDATGEVIRSNPAGFEDDPEPLPVLTPAELASRQLITVPSSDAQLDYRALVVPLNTGQTVVLAAPLHQIAEARQSLGRALLVAGTLVTLIGAAATWYTVRREFKPVDAMVETAEAIAGGDLTRRVPEADDDTELGRLANSLNDMLGHVEHAVVTERTAKEKLRQFVGDASHELRTPIAAVSGYAQLFRQGGLEDEAELARAMDRIESENKRMQGLVEDLLLLARLDRTDPVVSGPVDLATVVTSAVDDMRAIDPDRTVTFEGTAGAIVIGNLEQLFQVVTNLLNNARVHTPAGTPVEARLRTTDDEVTLEITDHGLGIPPESLDSIFERFYRVDTSRSRRRGGSGLGLAIVSAIVASHGGTVTASNSGGGGAIFTVTLPRLADTPSPQPEA